jgi:hypothetical protein
MARFAEVPELPLRVGERSARTDVEATTHFTEKLAGPMRI